MERHEKDPGMMKRIGITGEGKMGSNLFYYLSDFGYDLTWICSQDADTEKLLKTFQKKIKRSSEGSLITPEKYEQLQSATVISNDLSALSECDMVIEAVNENLPLKQALFHHFDSITQPHCILATNSSSILPAALVPSQMRQDKTIGLHFFYPVVLKNIVEFTILPETSETTKLAVRDFLTTIRRNAITLTPDSAFILNRIFLDIQREAYSIVVEGKASFGQVDDVIKENITSMGVFEFCDHVGIDTMLASVMNYTRADPGKDQYIPFMLKLDELVKAGRNGKKSGEGFFSYTGPAAGAGHEISSVLNKTITHRINTALLGSISVFSVLTGISEQELNRHMDEYLGRS
ncbi:MAG TPA: 3-hydroxyacyl-CoA dehydrogenase family protein [Bacteroidales bacterium]|nr:3-hydroxyacyl-CoA dehydrogenase family protein [Bacteroidales bacterium]